MKPRRLSLLIMLAVAAVNIWAMSDGIQSGWYAWLAPPLLIGAGWSAGFGDGFEAMRKLYRQVK